MSSCMSEVGLAQEVKSAAITFSIYIKAALQMFFEIFCELNCPNINREAKYFVIAQQGVGNVSHLFPESGSGSWNPALVPGF